jgi:hypothetical protein
VIVTADGLAAARAGRMRGEDVIAEAIRATLPTVRNVAVDLGSIRLTDPKNLRRLTLKTPDAVRCALIALVHGHPLEPFRFIISHTEPEVADAKQPPPKTTKTRGTKRCGY